MAIFDSFLYVDQRVGDPTWSPKFRESSGFQGSKQPRAKLKHHSGSPLVTCQDMDCRSGTENGILISCPFWLKQLKLKMPGFIAQVFKWIPRLSRQAPILIVDHIEIFLCACINVCIYIYTYIDIYIYVHIHIYTHTYIYIYIHIHIHIHTYIQVHVCVTHSWKYVKM